MKTGDIVVSRGSPFDGRLCCGSGIYTHAIVVNVDPLVLVSEDADMRWNGVQSHEVVALCEAADHIVKRAMKRFKKDYPQGLPSELLGDPS